MNWSKTIIRTALVALALGAMAPGSADAQVREKKQRTRITHADRKAAAEARKAKAAQAKTQAGTKAVKKTGGAR
ncbi:MAG: hypothetical protein HZB56_01655 [Deltaproteobacteria bacterium]|nr:hypothetical protein [Deltaproteobacteria bacterium]